MIRLLWFLCQVLFLLHVLSVVYCDYKPYDTLYEGPAGRIYAYDNVTLSLVCTENVTMLDAVIPLNNTWVPKFMSVGFCTPPETSYVEMLRTLNIDASKIEILTLIFKYNLPLRPRNYMQGLKIRQLALIIFDEIESRDIFRDVPDFLEPLSDVTEINLEAVLLPELPETMRLKRMTLRNNAALKSWGNCRHLEELSISAVATLAFPVWPENCTRLDNLQIDYMSPKAVRQVEASMIASAKSVRKLNVTDSRLRELPIDFLRLAKNLTHLDLSDNNFYDESFSQFPVLESLKWLDLSSNPASGYFLENVLPNVPALEVLRLNNNDNIRIFCLDEGRLEKSLQTSIGKLQQLPLKRLYLSATNIHLRCLRNTNFPKLEYINLYGTISPEMRLLDLPKSDAPDLHVDFGYTANSNFVNIYFTVGDYKELSEKNARLLETNATNRLTISLRYIKCDCENGWLVRALRDFPDVLSMPQLHCDHEWGVDVLDEPVDNIECTTWYDRYTLNEHMRLYGCLYRIRWRDNASYATCKEDQYPVFNDSVYGLNSSNSKLTQLYNELPDTIQWVDLRRNRISRANWTAASALFAAEREVWLGGNLIVCDCDNRALLDAIAEHRAQIKDYEDLTCVDSDIPLSAISTAELCQTALKLSVGSLGFMAGVALIAGFFLRKYGDEIKMFLYARGYCLSCVTKQDLDDRPYDAFLSYAHADEEYVKTHLLPGLESTKYRVCVHHRDWVVGDWIPAQIMRSVSLARRTIILLSTNFVKSMWSSLEFRYATANAAKDQRCRVLVLVLDNVLEEPLDPELVSYLYYNTYLRCDDPWFWEKLRYAMPHKSNKNRNEKRSQKDAQTQDYEMRARQEGVNMDILHSGDSANAMITQPNQIVMT